MPVKVSVVIPVWNAERFIEPTIDAIRRQTLPEWELIVVDDASTDATVDIVNRYIDRDPRIRLIKNGKLGRSAARNRGFFESDRDSPYIAFLDADDVWEDVALERLSRSLESNPDAVAAHGPIRQIDENGDLIARGRPLPSSRMTIGKDGMSVVPPDAPTTFHVLARQCIIHTTGAILLRRTALPPGELFSTALEGGEDWDLWLRISRKGSIAFVQEPVLRYRLHKNSMTHTDNQLLKAGYVSWKTIVSTENTPEQRHSAVYAAATMLANYLNQDELDVVSKVINKRLRR